MIYPTIIEFFEKTVNKQGNKVALKTPLPDRSGYEEATFRELEGWADDLAAALSKRVKKGDKVSILSHPRIEWAIALLGLLKVGAVAVPIDPQLQPEEVERLLAASDSVMVIASGGWLDRIQPAPTPEYLVTMNHEVGQQKGKKRAEEERVISFGGLLAEGRRWREFEERERGNLRRRQEELHPSDLAVIMFTSGTTGDAKGVMLTHENLSSNLTNALKMVDVTAQDVIISIAPWNHIFGLLVLLAGSWLGAKIIYTKEYMNLPKLLRENEATVLIGVPKLFHAMFEKVERELNSRFVTRFLYRLIPKLVGKQLVKKLSAGKLRFLLSGSAPLDPAVERGFRRLGIGVIEGYGMTETSPVLTVSTPFNNRFGSVGPPIPALELRIADPDEDGVGEVVVRGPNAMKGYYKNPVRTKETIDEEGWLHTGDLGILDEDGWLYLKGREKNVIILESGKNIYPEEVEFELARIPEIEEVMIQRGVRRGKEVIKALVYPNWEKLGNQKRSESPERIKHLIWEKIKERNQRIAHYKRVKGPSDLIIVEAPFEKTSTLDIRRYLYQEGARDGKLED